jgi:hypothetical protein
MARVLVHGATLKGGLITSLQVQLGSLPRRTIDRATAIAWLRDMHSFIPVQGGRELAALQLVEVPGEDEPAHFVRIDNKAEASDLLPKLPEVAA